MRFVRSGCRPNTVLHPADEAGVGTGMASAMRAEDVDASGHRCSNAKDSGGGAHTTGAERRQRTMTVLDGSLASATL